jgi:hypothetical protein
MLNNEAARSRLQDIRIEQEPCRTGARRARHIPARGAGADESKGRFEAIAMKEAAN